MTAKKTTGTTKNPSRKEMVDKYSERLLAGHERMTEAMQAARSRGIRVNEEITDWIVAGQRDTLELGKRLADDPTAYAKNMEAVLESLTSAQERALNLAKVLYREQAESTTALREYVGPMFTSSKNFGETAKKLASFWTGARA
jgi:hypothetical protein